ncbi:MAG: multiheme c-type cytochrome [Pirellulaceae bacterium]
MTGRFSSRRRPFGLLVACGMLLGLGCNSQADSTPGLANVPETSVVESEANPDAMHPPATGTAPREMDVPAAGSQPESPPQTAASEPEAVSEQGAPFRSTSEETPNPKPDEQQAVRTESSKDGKQELLFKGWPQPAAVLFLTGQQQGYIEPCGCTGLTHQKGGLNRRHTLAQKLRERGWEVVPLDVGNQVRRFGRQAEIKFQMTVYGMKEIGYRAIGFGADDLRLSAMNLFAETAAMGDQSTPFVSANASIYDPTAIPPYQIIELADGKKIGVTAIVGADWQSKITSRDIGLQDPVEVLTQLEPELRRQTCRMWILLAHASIEESRRLAEKFPVFKVVVSAGGVGDPRYQPVRIPGTDTLLVQVGVKGMYVGVLGWFDDPGIPFRYQRVPLDARFEDSAEMLQLLASYQEQLKTLGFEQLGLRPLPHPSGKTFVGSDTCGDCHTVAYEIWESTPHAHALDSLVNPGERSEVPRHFDPECLSCHVTGWDPQNYFPYTSGYWGLEETPRMHNVGCENCHGPGAEHVAAENGDTDLTDEEIDTLRAGMRLTLEQARKEHCMECHDLDNSPDFHDEGAFEEYWEQIVHEGMD